MGSKYLNKGRKFVLEYLPKLKNSSIKQLDVLAIDEETILVIECKTAEVYKTGDFKKELESYKSMLGAIETTLRDLFDDGGKKRVFKFILATKNLDLSEKDKERLEEIDGFHLNEDMIEYFFKLHEEIGEASRYQFMASLFEGVTIPNLDNEIPAIRGKMGEHTYYSFVIEPEKLLKSGYVLHKSKGTDSILESYQRLIKKTRLKSVREFVKSGGYFPNEYSTESEQPIPV